MDETLELARLREIFDGDRESIVEILRECATYVRRSLGELDVALAAKDPSGVARAAHGIKGSCGNVGAIACARAAGAIEAAARAGTLPGDEAAIFGRLVDAFEAAVARYELAGEA